MAELSDLLPMPPQFGPPLPGSLKVLWPWLKKPPKRQYVLPIVEEPEMITESQEAETAPAPPAPPAPSAPWEAPATRPVSHHDEEFPPESLYKLSPVRIDPSWRQADTMARGGKK